MAIVLSSDNFLASFGHTGLYWEIVDNISTDDLKKLRQKIPAGRQFVSAYVLRDTNWAWRNYSNTEVTYLQWEHASEHHAGAELRPILYARAWSILHPVGDIYVVYV
jgi:hypothetical protein